MNYKIIESDKKYSVLEKQTDQVIALFDSKEEARKVLRHLNFGGGFDGFTPSFMKKKYFYNGSGKLVILV